MYVRLRDVPHSWIIDGAGLCFSMGPPSYESNQESLDPNRQLENPGAAQLAQYLTETQTNFGALLLLKGVRH